MGHNHNCVKLEACHCCDDAGGNEDNGVSDLQDFRGHFTLKVPHVTETQKASYTALLH
jgi:hypothetical protein